MLAAVLDNLGKGASGAAVQNMNLMLGLDPQAGLATRLAACGHPTAPGGRPPGRRSFLLPLVRRPDLAPALPPAFPHPYSSHIGRAACRERGCQHGYISVGAV